MNDDTQGYRILDAMCKSGIETACLISQGASVTGLDISPNNAALYSKKWQRDCIVTTIHATGLPSNSAYQAETLALSNSFMAERALHPFPLVPRQR